MTKYQIERQRVMQRIYCDNLTISHNRHPVVHHLSLEFSIGHSHAIVGPNGAGKSTLLRGLLSEIKIDEGKVVIEGFCREDIAYLPQVSELDNSVPFTVGDVLCLGLLHTIGSNRGVARANDEKIQLALTQVGLAGYQSRYINELSKGELQRVLMAKIIMQNAQVIILDEPFNAMDSRTIDEILKLMHLWRNENKTIIAVLHDIQQVMDNFEYSIILAHELIAYGKTTSVLNHQNIEKAYKSSIIQYNTKEICDS